MSLLHRITSALSAARVGWQAPPESLRESPTELLVALGLGQQRVWSPDSYRAQAKDGYSKCAIAYACINEIADSLGSIEFFAEKRTASTGNYERVDGHPIIDLLSAPNPLQAGFEYRAEWATCVALNGNGYQEVIRLSTGPNGGQPQELYIKRPDRISLEFSKDGRPRAWVFDTGTNKFYWDIDPATWASRLKHTRLYNPLDDWFGLSPIRVAALPIDTWNSASLWNKSMLDNMAVPAGVLQTDQPVDTPTHERLKAQFAEKYTAAQKARKPLVLGSGLKWSAMGLSPVDMDWINSKKTTEQDICRVYKVPAQIIGIEGSQTFSNYEQANLTYWEKTINQWAKLFRSSINSWLVPMYGEDGLRVNFDISETPALAPRQNVNWERASSSQNFLTTNERREMVGKEPLEGGDVVLVDATKVPLEMAGSTEITDAERASFAANLRACNTPEDEIERLMADAAWLR